MRITPQSVVRSTVIALLTMVSAVALALTTTITSAVTLIAATPLIVPGTGTPNPVPVDDYMQNAVDYYIDPNGGCDVPGGCAAPVGIEYDAQFWPFPFEGWGGLQGAKWNVSVASGVESLDGAYDAQFEPVTHEPTGRIVVFGYSQGATVVSIFKKNLSEESADGVIPPYVSFVLIGNPNRPNGGLFERLAFLGAVPILDATFGNPTPTDTAPDDITNTSDIALQYDAVADAPRYPLNPLALLNALAGFWYVHGTYLNPNGNNPGEPIYGYDADEIAAIEDGCRSATPGPNCQVHGDTIYVTLPAKTLPIMQPFLDLAAATGTTPLIAPIVALVSPLTQTLIEISYDRSDYGKPTPFGLIPRIDPVKLAADLIADIPEGIEDAIGVVNGVKPDLSTPNHPPESVTTDSTETPQDAVTLTTALPEPKEPLANATSKSDAETETPAATKPQRPKVRNPIGSELNKARDGIENAVKGAVDSVTNALKPLKPLKPKPTPTGADEDGPANHEDTTSADAAA